uniref:Epoxide hydrolase 2 n=1 Tax=Zea mays TaxID=4577 RepID=B6TU84_MAIZE|nr:epoxide hydrolase 2 [Zea mays]
MAQEIEHTHIPIRGLNLHVAQVGTGELGTVVFLHGFPEIWYSWRHQMRAVAAAGYRAIAPDCRGYGLSEQPPEHEEVSLDDLIADVLGILDALSVPKAFLVGKDFGAMPAYEFALQHPGRTLGVVCLGIPFNPAPMSFDAIMPEGFYILRWREPGRAEADFGRFDVRRGAHHLRALRRRRDPDCQGRAGDHGPGRPVHAPPGVVHRGGPGRLRQALREVRLRVPAQDAVQIYAQAPEPAGRQVPGAGVHGDGGEGLRVQVPGVRDRHARRGHGQLHAGPQDHLHP